VPAVIAELVGMNEKELIVGIEDLYNDKVGQSE
jgi:hypothetical protein